MHMKYEKKYFLPKVPKVHVHDDNATHAYSESNSSIL